MVWKYGGGFTLAPALTRLYDQLVAGFPSTEWQNSPQTGTIGDSAHRASGSASDHNPWLNGTVRALDIATGIPGSPNGEALFTMVNRMYAARDPRVFPDGYAIYKGRITDWDNPGGFHAQSGDPHTYHVHISVSTNPNGYNSRANWPIGAVPVVDSTPLTIGDDMAYAVTKSTHPSTRKVRYWVTSPVGDLTEATVTEAAGIVAMYGLKVVSVSEASIAGANPAISRLTK